MKITIDTNILKKAFCDHEVIYWAVAALVYSSNSMLCVDFKYKIKTEYDKNLRGTPSFEKWYSELRKGNLIWHCNGKLPKNHKAKLQRLGCHEDADHIFIAVALYSDKILFSEDSDLGKGPNGSIPPHCDALKYLTEELKIQVCDSKEALVLLKKF